MEIGRLLTAMVTPFDDEGQLDYRRAAELALALLDSGSEGIVLAGTTGEAPTLSNEEKLRLFAEVKRAVGGRGAVIAGTGNYNTAESVELSREAERTGVDALLLTTPYYSKPPQEGIYRHFETIARATSLPCILYNIPGRTAVNVSAETMLRLARIPNITGVKEASGDLEQIARVIEDAPEHFRVWSGDDSLTLPILAIGGYGVISVCAHLVGGLMREMIDCVVAGDSAKAAHIHRRLLPLMTMLLTASSNPAPVKHALNASGFPVGGVRLPLVMPDDATGERIMTEVRRHRVDLAVRV
ncbi:MAG: 4-hydroxy-tetrahydrodipicolinate synthase [Chloroflexi bacterium]|nr:MAG: 4-hydroxy-tetrahydrodipicolinate synthase [Chloroflexota bacterium]